MTGRISIAQLKRWAWEEGEFAKVEWDSWPDEEVLALVEAVEAADDFVMWSADGSDIARAESLADLTSALDRFDFGDEAA